VSWLVTEELSGYTVVVGHPAGDRVVIRVIARMHGDVDDYWDGNWLISPIEIHLGGFQGTVPAGLRAEELRAFRVSLEEMYANLDGIAKLDSMEGWLALTVAIDRSGRLRVSGKAIDRLGSGNELSFRISEMDQSYLPPIINALSDIDTKFPVVGSP